MDDIHQLKKKTKIGMLWNTIERFSVQVISFIIGIILARLLTPDDYGTVGLLTVFITFSNVFIDSGFSRGLIQKIDRTEHDFSTTLIFNIIISVLIYGILFFCSPLIANFYNKPELVSLSRVLFITVVLNSLTVVQSAKLQIQVNFKKIALINLLTTIISGITAIIFAYNGMTYWSLVIQQIVRYVILVVLYWGLGKWIPKTGFSIDSFKGLFKYGSNLLLTGILATLIDNIQCLVIGKIYKPEQLGYYSRSVTFPALVSGTLTSVLNTVTFPMMSQLQDNSEELLKAFKKIIKITSLFVFPAMVGLAMISKTLIIVLLTEKWIASVPYLFWLSLSYIFSPLEIINLTLLNAIGRSDLNLKLDLLKTPFIVLCMVITLPISLYALVLGRACFALVYYIIDGIVTYRMFNFGPIKQLAIAWKYIAATIVMAFCLLIFNILFTSEGVLKIIIQLFLALFCYTIMLLILKDDEIRGIIRKVIMLKKNILCKRGVQ